MNEFQQRIGVGQRQSRFHAVAGSDKRVSVAHEVHGRSAGTQIDHWDGRRSAIVTPETTYLSGDN